MSKRRTGATDEVGLKQGLECVVLTVKFGQKLIICEFGKQKIKNEKDQDS